MKPVSKIFVTLLIVIFILIGSLFGIAVYFYYHPASIKSFVEKSASRFTGTSCSINELSYSLKPLRIEASGITFRPGKGQGGFQLEIPDLRADLKLEGPFSRRSLVVKGLKVDGFLLRISRDMDLAIPKIRPKSQTPSTLTKILKGGVALLLFRDISFGAAEITGGHVTADLGEQVVHASEIQASLNPDRLMEISCSTLIDWPSRSMRLIAPRVHMVTDHAISLVHPEIKGLLTVENAAFQSPEAGVKNIRAKTNYIYDHDQKKTTLDSLDLRFQTLKLTQELIKETTSSWSEADVDDIEIKGRLTYDHNKNEIRFEPLELNLKGIAPKQGPETELPPFNLHMRTSGITDLTNTYLEAQEFSLIVEDILKTKGRLNMGFGPQSEIMLDLQESELEPEKLVPYLPNGTKEILKPFTLSGPINLHGSFDGMKEAQAWSFDGDMEVRLGENRYAYRNDQVKLHGEITGTIRARGRYPDIKISAQMKVDDTVFSGKGVALKPLKTSLSISGTRRAFDIADLTAHIPQARIEMGKRVVSVDEIRLRLRNGKVDIEKRSARLPEILLDTSLLKNTRLALELDGKQAVMQIHGKDSHLMKAALDLNLFPSEWQLSGLDSIEGKVVLKENRYLSFVSQLGLSKVAFQNQDSSCMGENVALRSKLEGNLDLKGSDVAINGSIEVNGGEVLFDRFYLDLNQNAFLTTFRGKYDTSEQALDLADLTAALRDVVAIQMNGTLRQNAKAPDIQFSLKIPRTPLKPVFTQFIVDPFKTEKPFLTNLDLEGDISADLDLAWRKKDLIVKGQCRLHDGGFSWLPDVLSFKGIDLDYPVWYQPKLPGGVSELIKGELSIRSMIIPILPDQPLSIPLQAGPDRLRVKSKTTLKTPGGQVHIGPILCKGIYGSKPSIDTSVRIRNVEIQPLLSDIWPRPIEGVIDGNLSPVQFEGGSISTNGKLTANIFGGEIIISGLGASGIFSSAPVFRLSAELKNLNLAELTSDTSFGMIVGILEGYIRDLEIANGQPQQFDLLLQTVKTEGIPQKISVTAVDNIARIGGGQSPFMGGVAGAFASLFKEFPYKKIGIHAVLENDVFRINGTVRENGQEYMVKRGRFSGVDVVNINPDNSIRFKDMVERIKRVTSGSSPVVK